MCVYIRVTLFENERHLPLLLQLLVMPLLVLVLLLFATARDNGQPHARDKHAHEQSPRE